MMDGFLNNSVMYKCWFAGREIDSRQLSRIKGQNLWVADKAYMGRRQDMLDTEARGGFLLWKYRKLWCPSGPAQIHAKK